MQLGMPTIYLKVVPEYYSRTCRKSYSVVVHVLNLKRRLSELGLRKYSLNLKSFYQSDELRNLGYEIDHDEQELYFINKY